MCYSGTRPAPACSTSWGWWLRSGAGWVLLWVASIWKPLPGGVWCWYWCFLPYSRIHFGTFLCSLTYLYTLLFIGLQLQITSKLTIYYVLLRLNTCSLFSFVILEKQYFPTPAVYFLTVHCELFVLIRTPGLCLCPIFCHPMPVCFVLCLHFSRSCISLHYILM